MKPKGALTEEQFASYINRAFSGEKGLQLYWQRKDDQNQGIYYLDRIKRQSNNFWEKWFNSYWFFDNYWFYFAHYARTHPGNEHNANNALHS